MEKWDSDSEKGWLIYVYIRCSNQEKYTGHINEDANLYNEITKEFWNSKYQKCVMMEFMLRLTNFMIIMTLVRCLPFLINASFPLNSNGISIINTSWNIYFDTSLSLHSSFTATASALISDCFAIATTFWASRHL